MRTPASIAGHPLHPMLIPLPIGLWIFSLVCDVIFKAGSGASVWSTVAFYTLIGGLIGGLAAAVPGFIDMLFLRDRPKKLALTHMAINLTVILLYGVNIGMRIASPEKLDVAIGLSAIGVALLAVSGWLGGQMVYIERVAVREEHDHTA